MQFDISEFIEDSDENDKQNNESDLESKSQSECETDCKFDIAEIKCHRKHPQKVINLKFKTMPKHC